MEASEVITLVLASIGGSVLVLGGLAAWLGTVWAKRVEIKEKAQLEAHQSRVDRVSDAQFSLYSEVWDHLQRLKDISDRLWERATAEDAVALSFGVENARIALNRGRLVLPAAQHTQISRLLTLFGGYSLGKLRLVQLRTEAERQEAAKYSGGSDVRTQILRNRSDWDEYQVLIEDVLAAFRKDIGVTA